MILNEYFKDKEELACPCSCGLMPHTRAVELLYALRILIQMPIYVNSGARCDEYNKTIPGSSKMSLHTIGAAFDIRVADHKRYEYYLIKKAIMCGFTGIGIRDNTYLHIDTGNPPTVWGYPK